MACAVENAISLQRENIIENRPFVPPNDCITFIRRVKSRIRSSSRIRSDATDTVIGSIDSRAGSISWRQHGHVFLVFNDFNKHVVQNVCPHAVMETLIFLVTSKHTAHFSLFSSGSSRQWWFVSEEADCDGDGEGWFHKYCIEFDLVVASLIKRFHFYDQFLHKSDWFYMNSKKCI